MAGATPATFEMASRRAPLDYARLLLGDDDVTTALLSDPVIEGALVLGWNRGMAVLAQNLISRFSQEVTEKSESAGPAYRWQERLVGWKQVLADAKAGNLPDPTEQDEDKSQYLPLAGSVFLNNKPI